MFRFEAPCILVIVVVLLYASGWCSLERASSLGLGSRVRTTNVRSKWWLWQWVAWLAGVPNNQVLAACNYKRISMSTSSGRWHHDCAKTASNHKLERNSRRCLDASCIIYPWTKIATSQNWHIYIYIYVQFDTTIWISYHMNNIIYGRSRRVTSEALIDEQNANKKRVVKIKLLSPYLPTSTCNESRNCHSPAKPGNNHDI